MVRKTIDPLNRAKDFTFRYNNK